MRSERRGQIFLVEVRLVDLFAAALVKLQLVLSGGAWRSEATWPRGRVCVRCQYHSQIKLPLYEYGQVRPSTVWEETRLPRRTRRYQRDKRLYETPIVPRIYSIIDTTQRTQERSERSKQRSARSCISKRFWVFQTPIIFLLRKRKATSTKQRKPETNR